MTTTSGSTLALAAHLRALNDGDLGELLRARGVRDSGVSDFFDLADKLLERASVQTALAALDRPTLTTLAAMADLPAAQPVGAVIARLAKVGVASSTDEIVTQLAAAERLGLASHTDDLVTVWDTVGAQLAEWPGHGLPGLKELAAPWTPPTHHVSSDASTVDAIAAERAFATTMAAVEIVAEHQHEAARELAKGGLALPDAKRLAVAAAVEPEEVQALHGMLVRAGLLSLDAGLWTPTEPASAWMMQPTPAMWSRLAESWLAALPGDIRRLLAGRTHAAWNGEFRALVEWLYPAAGTELAASVVAHTHVAELLGITAEATPSTPGALLLDTGVDAATAAMAKLLPREVHQVYLQHDLSIVSPGPLAPRLDARLRTMASVESHGLASSYRISLASVDRALTLGESAESITQFLGELSLTGIPQPLAYLISEAAARYGLVRVGATPENDTGARSYVRSNDGNLLGTILVDHSLSALALTRQGNRLVSRFDKDTVFWSINEARYPVAAENAKGEIVALRRRHASASSAQPTADPVAAIIERLRASSTEASDDNDRAWLERQLDAAVKARLTITVSVTVQDGSSVDYVLEPTGLGGGRLRGRDRKADIERTLPLARITSVSGPV